MWRGQIQFSSNSGGMKVQLNPTSIVPNFTTTRCDGDVGHDTREAVYTKFRQVFPDVINFESIISGLKSNFEGSWTGLQCDPRDLVVRNPVFNKRGDFMLDLAVKNVESVNMAENNANGRPEITINGANGYHRDQPPSTY